MEDRPIAERVVRYVLTISEEEFAALSVSRLAQIFKVDRFKLSREFKQQTEMKLEEFLFREKMTRAALMLLAYRDITVREVAERIGFCTYDYFIRVFRQFFGVVPGRFREYKIPRSGGDRRNGKKDRRQRILKGKIPESGNRRKNKSERRKGTADRRNQNGNDNNQKIENLAETLDSQKGLEKNVMKEQEAGNGKLCKNCYFRRFALNYDDWK